ncbi:MAG TPA: type II secretion system protein GspC [Kofleriaceae bacterium]|nr:type II secretion system protein GspC [Kofleriaceae bacterium]
MQELVKRYFWVVIALAVAGSAVFAAKLTNHVLAGKVLADARHGPRVTRPMPAMNVAAANRSKDGQPIIDRNMFCSDCQPPVAEVAQPTAPVDPSVIPFTALPLELIATHVSEGPHADRDSHAFILNTATQMQGAYWIGHEIPGAGPIVAVHHKYVDFTNIGTKRTERISLLGDVPAPPPPPVAVAQTTPDAGAATGDDALNAAIEAGVRKIDDSNYDIDRSLVDKVLANPMAIAKGARVMPSSQNGEPNGFRLYAVRPSSVYAKLGFANGDTIHAINGFELNSMDKAMEVYGKLRDAGSLQVNITRRGKPVTLNYTIH